MSAARAPTGKGPRANDERQGGAEAGWQGRPEMTLIGAPRTPIVAHRISATDRPDLAKWLTRSRPARVRFRSKKLTSPTRQRGDAVSSLVRIAGPLDGPLGQLNASPACRRSPSG